MRVWFLLLALALLGAVYWWWRKRMGPSRLTQAGGIEGARLYAEGMHYRQGLGVDVDYPRARQTLLRAAELGHAAAQYDLGLMLDEGLGGTLDEDSAMQWIERAAQGGDLRALLRMGKSSLESGDVDEKGQAEAWLLRAAEAGSAEGQYLLATQYRDKKSPLWNSLKAVHWISKAAEQGYPPALFALSEMYANGSGVAKNIPQSDAWLLKAAQQGVPEAMLKLGQLYLTGAFGHSFKQDYHAALDWFRRAGAQGVGEAEYEVGLRYEHNEGVSAPDMKRAVEYFLNAARLGFAPAQYRMGQLYRLGHHVPQDLEKSRHWFAAAEAQGYGDSAEQVKAVRLRQMQEVPPLPMEEPLVADSKQGVDWEG
jgi:TPR repeat protein